MLAQADTTEPEGHCPVRELLASLIGLCPHGGGAGWGCSAQHPAHGRHSAGACALMVKWPSSLPDRWED